ncbi:hypothetical protein KC366_g89 [Hortaea werneckii]|nr:hypothetical protein KC366_g89 [Hortaea werneckii]
MDVDDFVCVQQPTTLLLEGPSRLQREVRNEIQSCPDEQLVCILFQTTYLPELPVTSFHNAIKPSTAHASFSDESDLQDYAMNQRSLDGPVVGSADSRHRTAVQHSRRLANANFGRAAKWMSGTVHLQPAVPMRLVAGSRCNGLRPVSDFEQATVGSCRRALSLSGELIVHCIALIQTGARLWSSKLQV